MRKQYLWSQKVWLYECIMVFMKYMFNALLWFQSFHIRVVTYCTNCRQIIASSTPKRCRLLRSITHIDLCNSNGNTGPFIVALLATAIVMIVRPLVCSFFSYTVYDVPCTV